MKNGQVNSSHQERRAKKRKKKNINLAIVSDNNHYAGFGPGTANIFRKMVGLPKATWEEKSHSLSNTHSPIKAKYSLKLYDIKLHNCLLLICCCSSILAVLSMSIDPLTAASIYCNAAKNITNFFLIFINTFDNF
jgi:hypothetical protein